MMRNSITIENKCWNRHIVCGVTKILNAGYSIESSKKAIQLAEEYDFVYASVGVSPNDVEDKLDLLPKLAAHPKVVAIGEIGLDYYWNKENKELQKEIFMRQIEIANEIDLPIIVHTRDSEEDTIDILKNKRQCKNKGVFHCCLLNKEFVKEALKLDYYISFSGVITFKNSKNAEEIINMVPLERILIETDAPYLSPEPLRGKRNDSRNLRYVAQKIAEAKKMKTEEIAKITYNNAINFFLTDTCHLSQI